MPFITEELWQRLPHEGPSLMIAPWPQRDDIALPTDDEAVAQFGSLQALARSVRNARAEYRVEPGKKIAATVLVDGDLAEALEAEADALAFMARVDPAQLKFESLLTSSETSAGEEDGSTVRLVVGESLNAFLPLADLIDAAKERQRLGKQQKTLEESIAKINARMSSPGFAGKAPPAVVQKAETELAEQQEQLSGVVKALARLPPPDAEELAAMKAAEELAAAEAAAKAAKAAAKAAAAAAAAEAESARVAALLADPEKLATLEAAVAAQGNEVRKLKDEGLKKGDPTLKAAVAKLVELKAQLPPAVVD